MDAAILAFTAVSIAGCSTVSYQVRTGVVHASTLQQMENYNMDRGAPVLIRIYKEERTLEVWKQDRTGKVYAAPVVSDLQIFRKTWSEDRSRG